MTSYTVQCTNEALEQTLGKYYTNVVLEYTLGKYYTNVALQQTLGKYQMTSYKVECTNVALEQTVGKYQMTSYTVECTNVALEQTVGKYQMTSDTVECIKVALEQTLGKYYTTLLKKYWRRDRRYQVDSGRHICRHSGRLLFCKHVCMTAILPTPFLLNFCLPVFMRPASIATIRLLQSDSYLLEHGPRPKS